MSREEEEEEGEGVVLFPTTLLFLTRFSAFLFVSSDPSSRAYPSSDRPSFPLLSSAFFPSFKLAAVPSTTRRVVKVLGWVAVGLFINDHVVTVKYVTGRSMQPTFNPDSSHMYRDIVLVNRYAALAAAFGDKTKFKPGDVVALKSPVDPSNLLIKRLIALPSTLVRTLPPYPESTLRVPQGHCWVEGDERYHTRDSNVLGPVPLGCVEGKVAWILWPPSRFGPVADRPGWEKRVVTPRQNFFAAE